MDEEGRISVVVLGHEIGTASGWDIMEDYSFCLYAFRPINSFPIPKGDIVVNYDKGLFQWPGEDGEIIAEISMIETFLKAGKVT